MIQAFPFTLFTLAAYNAVAFLLPDLMPRGWETPIAEFQLFSGAHFVLDYGHLMVMVGLFFLFVEMLRSTIASSGAILNHMASVLVLLVYVIEFVAVRHAGNSVFFPLTLIALVDVLAGFAVTARVSSRDVTYHDGY